MLSQQTKIQFVCSNIVIYTSPSRNSVSTFLINSQDTCLVVGLGMHVLEGSEHKCIPPRGKHHFLGGGRRQ